MIISLILALYLTGVVGAYTAYSFLYVCGLLLLIGELVAGGHGLIALNGLIAFFVGYAIQTGDNMLFGVPIDWSVLFGVAFVEVIVLIISVYVFIRLRRLKTSTGAEAMIGKTATVIRWKDDTGIVLIEGETWKAKSARPLQLEIGEEITVEAIEGLTLRINI
jgi:membrane-bound serine protease (ClpP class)